MNDNELSKTVDELRAEYEKHFNTNFPSRIFGWWDPLLLDDEPELFAKGVRAMKRDVKKAIRTNTPISEIPEEEWKHIIF